MVKSRHRWAALIMIPTGVQAAAPAVPGFWQLEAAYSANGDPSAAARQMSLALPPGTPLARARSALEGAGATCKIMRNTSATLKCLIHQYSLADGAADDIRWTIWVDAPTAVVSDIKLDRYVDRHGSN